MSRHVLDDRMIAGLHLVALRTDGHDHEVAHAHVAAQVGTIGSLLDANYDGAMTLGELVARGDLGIGTTHGLGGELLVVDGELFLANADGVISSPAVSETTPFAVVCPEDPFASFDASGTGGQIEQEIVKFGAGRSVIGVRIEGTFDHVSLRSVERQEKPYPPLAEAVKHQHTFSCEQVAGTIVGFCFPDALAGIEVPGFHLHFITKDRTRGGHVMEYVMTSGTVSLTEVDDLHVELPAGVDLGTPGDGDRATIRSVEGGA
jgi:acetolactate decarboxylase